MFRLNLLLVLCVSLLLCSIPAARSMEITGVTHTNADHARTHYPVFIVTDRAMKKTSKGFVFTSDRSEQTTYALFTPNYDAAPTRIKMDQVKLFDSRKTFLDDLAKTGAPEIAVFVHGYRKSFRGSLDFARRIARQIKAPVVLFAWPSKNSYPAYMTDECTAEWSSFQFADLLHSLGTRFGDRHIDIISHSLGARIVIWSLRIMVTRDQLSQPFRTSIFFAPDIDRDTFLADGPLIKRSFSRAKIYLDRHDSRIWLSRILHGNPRVSSTDETGLKDRMTGMFQFNTSMPSHEIPYPLLSTAMQLDTNTTAKQVGDG